MKELFSLQLDADKLNKQLYLKELKSFKNTQEIYSKIINSNLRLINKYGNVSDILLHSTLEIDEEPHHYFKDIHAQYINDAGEKKIWINSEWVNSYAELIGNNLARELHIAHELYHYLEENEVLWYENLRRKEKNIISEVSAIMFSQMIVNLKENPVIYEYLILIKNNKLDLENVKQHIEEVYHEIY